MSDQHSSDAGFPEVPPHPSRPQEPFFAGMDRAGSGGLDWRLAGCKALTEKGPAITITFKSAKDSRPVRPRSNTRMWKSGWWKKSASPRMPPCRGKSPVGQRNGAFHFRNTRFWLCGPGSRPAPYTAWGRVFRAYMISTRQAGKSARSFKGLKSRHRYNGLSGGISSSSRSVGNRWSRARFTTTASGGEVVATAQRGWIENRG